MTYVASSIAALDTASANASISASAISFNSAFILSAKVRCSLSSAGRRNV